MKCEMFAIVFFLSLSFFMKLCSVVSGYRKGGEIFVPFVLDLVLIAVAAVLVVVGYSRIDV